MRRSSLRFACLLLLALPGTAEGQATDIAATYRAAADSLIRAATRDSAAYTRIGNLVDKFGHRIAGSRSLEAAIDWVLAEMGRDGLQNVRGEPVQVTNWVRGEESAVLTRPRRDTLSLLGLGGSVGTPKGGITAPVLVVASFDELKQRASEARGKIVLFDAPVHELRGDAALSHQRPVGRGPGGRGGLPDPVGRVVLHQQPAHGPDLLRQHGVPDSGRGAQRRGRDDAAPHAGSG